MKLSPILVWISATLFVGPVELGAAEEEARARQIVVGTREEAEAVRGEILAKGGDRAAFLESARRSSKDPITKRAGGDLGWISMSDLAQDTADPVHDLEMGKVSPPLRSRSGAWVLISLEGRRERRPKENIIRDWFPPRPPPPPREELLAIARITTTKGTIAVRLHPGRAPNTVANFIALSRKGFYGSDPSTGKEMTFYRAIPGTVVVTGSPTNDATGGPGYRIASELEGNRGPHVRGTLSMLLETGEKGLPVLDSAGSQFMICLRPLPAWNGLYAPFGEVFQGLEVLEKLGEGDRIESIAIETDPDCPKSVQRLGLGQPPPSRR
jgi:peptidyl-prolyl cis-trans isomerase B (cyclophilin B)